MELNFEGLEMQKLILLTDRVQRVYEENRIIFIVIMFTTSKLWSSRCQKWLIFAKNQPQFGQNV